MPRSRRAKVVPLTKVQKKTKEHKMKLVDSIREDVGRYTYCHVVEVDRLKTVNLQRLREMLKPGRLVGAKNRLLQVALGANPESALVENIYKLSGLFTGNSMLLLSNQSKEELDPIFSTAKEKTYANPGDTATETVTLNAGFEDLAHFQHTMEPLLRKLGLPTQLMNGKIALLGDFVVCEEGTPLSVNAAKLLRHLNRQQAVANVEIKGSFNTKTQALSIWKA